jgi:ribokinase
MIFQSDRFNPILFLYNVMNIPWFPHNAVKSMVPVETRCITSLQWIRTGAMDMNGNNGQPKIVVVGSINMDLLAQANHLPQPGETVIGSHYQYCPGGKGANQAVAAARLGAGVTLIGQVGEDEAGTRLLEGLQHDQINIHAVVRTSVYSSGLAVVTVDPKGENTIVVIPGANQGVDQAYVQKASQSFIDADVVLLQLEIPMSGVIEAAQQGHRAGAKVMLNPSPIQSLPRELSAHVHVLVLNQQESQAMTGCSEPDAAAKALIKQGFETAVLTVGANGAWVVNQTMEHPMHVPGIQVKAVDSTGAGDAFTGVLAVALAERQEIVAAVQFANRAGAYAATVLGAQPALPYRDALVR